MHDQPPGREGTPCQRDDALDAPQVDSASVSVTLPSPSVHEPTSTRSDIDRIQSYRPIPGDIVRTTRQLSITLPNQMADALRERVQSGQYASESEVIRDGLRALFAREAAVEAWLRDEVAAAHDAAMADPASTATADEVRQRLAARRADS